MNTMTTITATEDDILFWTLSSARRNTNRRAFMFVLTSAGVLTHVSCWRCCWPCATVLQEINQSSPRNILFRALLILMAYKPLLNTFIIKGTVSNTYIITNQTHIFTETIKICLKKTSLAVPGRRVAAGA